MMKNQMPNEACAFVLDADGRRPRDETDLDEYVSCFSPHDVVQYKLGDCYMLAILLSLIKNKTLMAHVLPIDNAFERNVKLGVYHFRLWHQGDWHDVVVDDVLPCGPKYDILFTHNKTYINELWAVLLEKAIAKYTFCIDIKTIL